MSLLLLLALLLLLCDAEMETGEVGAGVREHYALFRGDGVLGRGRGGGGQDSQRGGGAGELSCRVHR